MDVLLEKELTSNISNYKSSLERIIDKYSKLQYLDGGVEVDLDCTKTHTLERYMKQSKAELSKLESKSVTDLREESMRDISSTTAQDITSDTQLDFTYQDGGADETCVSTAQLYVEDDGDVSSPLLYPTGTTSNDTTRLTVSSLDESQRNISETEVQPEDQDEELEMSLRSHGSSSLVELYPSMISRIGRAWHRQHVSEAADSVLRRYRRWRQQSNRSNLSNTFVVTLRHARRNPQNMTSQTLLEENASSPVKRQFMGTETSPRSPLRTVTNAQDWREQQQSPGRVRREQPVLVMDFSDPSEPKESFLNETFTVCEVSRLEEQPSTYTFSPSRSTTKVSLDQSLRSRRLSLTVHSLQTDGCSTYASETVRERPDIYGSPVRPLQARMMSNLNRSPIGFSRSPKAHSVESFSREPTRSRLTSTSPQKALRMLHPQDSHHSLRSPQSATAAEGCHRLRRHLSFDSSLPFFSYSPKKLDEDFLRLYHKSVCQNKSSFFNRLPCRLCARSTEASRSAEASRSPSSSALAALALSPHRSLLRKRHRELEWDSRPQSKRYRDGYCLSSPGSIRHGKEMLRNRFSPSKYEQSHDGLSYSLTKPAMFQRFNTQRRSADAHLEACRSPRRRLSAADFSGMGSSLESRMTNGFSPRKW